MHRQSIIAAELPFFLFHQGHLSRNNTLSTTSLFSSIFPLIVCLSSFFFFLSTIVSRLFQHATTTTTTCSLPPKLCRRLWRHKSFFYFLLWTSTTRPTAIPTATTTTTAGFHDTCRPQYEHSWHLALRRRRAATRPCLYTHGYSFPREQTIFSKR